MLLYTVDHKKRQSRKARRFGLCSPTCLCDVSEYMRLVDSRLFNRIQSPFHCLSHLLPPEKNTTLAYVLEVTVIHSLYVQYIYIYIGYLDI